MHREPRQPPKSRRRHLGDSNRIRAAFRTAVPSVRGRSLCGRAAEIGLVADGLAGHFLRMLRRHRGLALARAVLAVAPSRDDA